MKRIFGLLFLSVFFTMCKSKAVTVVKPKVEAITPKEIEIDEVPEIYYIEDIRNDFRAVSENTKDDFLKAYRAKDSIYSILFFTKGFSNDTLKVFNEESVVYKGLVNTDLNTGLAKNMRLDNTLVNSVYDATTGKTIEISPEKAKKYKFIYIMRNQKADLPYKITFSNLLRPSK